MRTWISIAVAVFAFSAAPARAGLFGRTKVESRWTVKKVEVNGDDAEWNESSAFEEDGLAIMAMNDKTDLYLLITAHTRESRDQLSGESHQDLSLWFVGADGKTRKWGARIPFSHRSPLSNAIRDPAGVDPEPEYTQYQGAAISTDALPEDIVDRLAGVGRRPIWELKIPLKRVEINPEGGVAMDFVVNAPPGGPKRKALAAKPAADSGEDREAAAGAPGRGHGKRGGDSASHPEDLVWDASSYSLSIRLAPDPSLPR